MLLTNEVLGVREDYLAAARQAVEERYGSLNHYLCAAEVSHAEIAGLRITLIE
ncbi:MAG: tyrosine-protein phosphatase [Actinomycetia bacterium]|nr:tyrosine-protein phosphatase [Actinomycetes bacterium]